jgi:hypothetical protein
MCGNGVLILLALSVWYAAAAGATMCGISVLRIGTTIGRTTGTTLSGFGWCAHKQKKREQREERRARFVILACWQQDQLANNDISLISHL